MNHSFDIDIAIKYGVQEAILIENFRFWIAKNKANGKHYYDGRWWTYNSAKALAELFPYWSSKQIERLLASMKSSGILVTGHYSQNTYDRTNWYSIAEDAIPNSVESIPRNKEMETHKNGESITDITTDVTTDVNDKTSKTAARFVLPDWIPSEVWSAFLETRKKKKAANTDFAYGLVLKTLNGFRERGFDPVEVLENSIRSGWSDVYEPKNKAGNRTTSKVTESYQERASRVAAERMAEFAPGVARKISRFDAETVDDAGVGNVIAIESD